MTGQQRLVLVASILTSSVAFLDMTVVKSRYRPCERSWAVDWPRSSGQSMPTC